MAVDAKEKAATNARPSEQIETFEIVPLDLIGSDASYQRYVSMNYVQQLTERWDPRASGALLLSQRKNGAYFIVDGQHRLEAMKLLGYTEAPARVRHDLKEAEEAEIRLATQFVKPERAWERFKARLAAKDKEAIQILNLCRVSGAALQLEATVPDDAPNMIRSVRSVESIYNFDKGVTLTSLFNLLMDVDGEINQKNTRGIYFRGLGWFLFKHPDADRDALVKLLRTDWAEFENRARRGANPFGSSSSLWSSIYKELVAAYNRATKSNLEVDVKGSSKAMGPQSKMFQAEARREVIKRAGRSKSRSRQTVRTGK